MFMKVLYMNQITLSEYSIQSYKVSDRTEIFISLNYQVKDYF